MTFWAKINHNHTTKSQFFTTSVVSHPSGALVILGPTGSARWDNFRTLRWVNLNEKPEEIKLGIQQLLTING